MIIINNIKLGIDEDTGKIKEKIKKKLKIKYDDFSYEIYRKSIDARKKNNILFVYQVLVDIELSEKRLLKLKDNDVKIYEEKVFEINPIKKFKKRPIVVGLGPAGLFCGYMLAKNGYKPIIIERGKDVDSRADDIEYFWETGKLNYESNVQFGEGGAGTFSDGKLTSRSNNFRIREVLKTFVENGAPEEILILQKPHIGTDLLREVVKNIREKIVSYGGKVHFETKLEDIKIENKKVVGIKTSKGDFETEDLFLAIGHSARDTFKMILDRGIEIGNKAFAVGFRIEHPQILIDKSQYGESFASPKLSAAEYQLTYKSKEGRGVYTFCMCPGGRVISASSFKDELCVNGMSYHARDLENANSAIIANVSERDYGEELLAGMYFQEGMEKKAYELGGGKYFAPVQLIRDYIDEVPSREIGKVKPSYKPGYKLTDLNSIYPKNINEAIKEAIINLDKKLKGFSLEDGVLTGVETRSSSPIRILRDKENYQSINTKGLYPIGEGAGYAGGIMSSAVDGITAVEKIVGSED
ncbi:NAD(P)/FAD-dependent oxidoreductase [Miniphocaeibacter halophilus]|uniref:NAD(P)/FAD-dependent oxidoreductase n=1 Tax=Miniphocaeibacter halophilus TaxID=2931922 RepID=A0AC61N038_9FIRM|nr:NAD(P)/FAD-dependent oxidoreductase [Miniphocaeibacter halophilus]QQK08674.1 NAD(P)/FAD-dependent oxidoreductase [Miniphocaeibacter halophilus]